MEYEVDMNDVDTVCREYAGFHRLNNTQLSTLFKFQYYYRYKDGGFDLLSVNDIIQNIDKGIAVKGMKEASRFKHAPLNRFYHQHVFDLRYLPENIVIELKEKDGKTKKELKPLLEKYVGKTLDEKFFNEASSILVFNTIDYRINENRFTGEWMLYAKEGGKNYMLCFADHTDKETDSVLYEFIKRSCCHEFPFLFE